MSSARNAVVHRLPDGRWRVTNAPPDWKDDGRDYPEPQPTDRVFEHEADAVREYFERTAQTDPADDIPDPDGETDGWAEGE